ncbi:MAG: eCIS core domain-containing protein [Saccharospirillum sp.]
MLKTHTRLQERPHSARTRRAGQRPGRHHPRVRTHLVAVQQKPEGSQKAQTPGETDKAVESAGFQSSEGPGIGADNSVYEQEADRVAAAVMQSEAHQSHTDPVATADPLAMDEGIQRQCADCDEEIQLKAEPELNSGEPGAAEPVPAGLWARIKGLFSRGRPLRQSDQQAFARHLGHDFTNTRLHTDAESAAITSALGATAFTYRHHVFFAQGAYAPDQASGRFLLAHELTHVVQQGAAPPLADHRPITGSAGPQVQRSAWDSIKSAGSSAAGWVSDRTSDALDVGADVIWAAVRAVAPRPLMNLINDVREKGFFGYIKEMISDVTDRILSGLGDGSPTLSALVTLFSSFAINMTNIVAALSQGNCEPLFAALRQMRDVVAQLAESAWQGLVDFFTPIGDFFSDAWDRFGAPVLEWLGDVASSTWEFISSLGEKIWEWTRPVVDRIRSLVSGAWEWIQEQLGLGGGASEGGLVQWVQDQAASAWGQIKETLRPVTDGIERVINRVREFLPLNALARLQERIAEWMQGVSEMAAAMDDGEGGDVADQQVSLREHILPAMLARVQAFRETLSETGAWVAEQIGGLVSLGQQWLGRLAVTPLLSGISGAFDWLRSAMDRVGTWAQEGVQGLFNWIGRGLERLSQFIEPVLNALQRIVSVVGDLLGRLPDFLLGPIWWVLPECIKNPIKQFFIEQILGRIPLFQQLVAVGDVWERVRGLALRVLQQMFIDGNLAGAAWTFFREMLSLIGIPVQLVIQIVANAAQAFADILMDPIGFLGNLLRAMREGCSRFFGDILTHLFNGVTGWLFGQITEAGLTPPDITSFRSVLNFLFEVLGLTVENLWNRLAEQVGRPMVDRIRGAIEFVQGAWSWVQVAVTEGLPGMWRLIQEQLTGLWNTVLSSVVTWVNTAIIATASRWLLSLLDVSGITPVINALIAIYNAIESFIEYLNEMLAIVATVTLGIADIARGAIDTAANFLVDALASSLPIVIGFLANQFGLGRLGSRIAELVESLRERVNAAIDWIISTALRVGQGFIDMLRSGVEMVRNWWQQRKDFTDSAGEQHELYFRDANSDLMVASTPSPVGAFLNQLVIAEDDPQKTQKDNHKRTAQTKLDAIHDLKRSLNTASRSGGDTSDDQARLNALFDELATELTPLMVPTAGSGGRVPSPLTLATLDEGPVAMPRTPEEESADLNAAGQLVLLAQERADGTEELASWFERIQRRMSLEEVSYVEQDERIEVKLRASREQRVSVSEALRGQNPGVNLSNEIRYQTGTAGGDTVGVEMEAANLGPSHPRGSEPSSSALADVMSRLVTNPSARNPSKYIKGHLLNHHIGGPGTAENLYPITAEANSAHLHQVESTVKDWVDTRLYWVYYKVQVQGIREQLNQPGQHLDNHINARFDCHAYVKKTDGTRLDEFTRTIQSTYVRDAGEDHQNPNPDRRSERTDNAAQTPDDDLLGGRQFDGEILTQQSSGGPYRLDAGLYSTLNNLGSYQANADRVHSTLTDPDNAISGIGTGRISTLLLSWQDYHLGDLSSRLSSTEKSNLTIVNRHADAITEVIGGIE